MANVTIPTGQSRDGWIWICVNGQQQWVKAGEPTQLDASEVGALANAGVSILNLDAAGLPEGALGYADFAAGTYYLFDASYDIADLFGDDGYNPDDILVGDIIPGLGWAPSGVKLVGFKGAALAMALAGFTAVIDVTLMGEDDLGLTLEVIDTIDMDPTWAAVYIARAGASSGISIDAGNNVTEHDPEYLSEGRHKVAVTIVDGKIAASFDGGAVLEILASWPTVPNAADLYFRPQPGSVMHSLVFYPPQANAALPGLSTL